MSGDARLLHVRRRCSRRPGDLRHTSSTRSRKRFRGSNVARMCWPFSWSMDGDLRCAHVRGHRASYLKGWRMPIGDDRGLVARAAATQMRATMPRDGRGLLFADRSAVAVPWMDGSTLTAIAYASSMYPAAENLVAGHCDVGGSIRGRLRTRGGANRSRDRRTDGPADGPRVPAQARR